MSQIYNLTSDVTMTSFQMESTLHLNIFRLGIQESVCKVSLLYLISRYDVIDADVKGATICSPPPSGRWMSRRPSSRWVNNKN